MLKYGGEQSCTHSSDEREEYDIPLEAEMREDVKVMCNLSLGIEEEALKRGMEKGMEKGMEQGREEGVALTIHSYDAEKRILS